MRRYFILKIKEEDRKILKLLFFIKSMWVFGFLGKKRAVTYKIVDRQGRAKYI